MRGRIDTCENSMRLAMKPHGVFAVSVLPPACEIMAVMACLEELLSDGGSQLRIDRRPPHELVRRLKLGGSTLVVDEELGPPGEAIE